MVPIPILSLIVFFPVFGALVALALGHRPRDCRWVSLVAALAEMGLVVSLLLADLSSKAIGDWLIREDFPWIEGLGVRFSLGLDAVSLVLIGLAAFLTVLGVLVSWREIDRWVGPFHAFLLLMEAGVMGVFLATDLFLFYLFWELQLVPMFFIIGIWGHEKRVGATVKFVLFSMTGSLLMLAALISLYLLHGTQTGVYTFSSFDLTQTALPLRLELLLFGAFLLSFAIKIPVVPVHTWLPDAHTEAPTAGSVILAGLLLKTGAYALLRFGMPLFPAATRTLTPLLVGVGLAGLFYASWVAVAQRDMKRLVAYSSIGHMGLIVLGTAVWNLTTLSGSVLQMVNHGLTTSALFILVGMLDARLHSRDLADAGGLWKRMPVFSAFFLFFSMAALGLPGLNNFVGEVLILLGTFKVHPVAGCLGFAGLVLVLVYVLRLVQEALFGPPRDDGLILRDVTRRELAVLVSLAVAVLFLGLYPRPVLEALQSPLQGLIQGTAQIVTARGM